MPFNYTCETDTKTNKRKIYIIDVNNDRKSIRAFIPSRKMSIESFLQALGALDIYKWAGM